MFAELVELHQRTWTVRGKPGAFSSARFRRFHERIIERGLPRGEIQLIRVSAGADSIGVLYNLCCSGHVAYYQSGLRYEADQKLKPGLVCHALAVERALQEGFDEYDFLAAANEEGNRYKQSLCNATRELGWLTFRRESVRTRAADITHVLKQRLMAR